MLKNYRTWFWLAVVFQLLNAALHSVSLFVALEPANETERRLIELLNTYHFEMGAGFNPTMSNLFTALSSCFTLLCAFAGAVNAFVLRRDAVELMSGILLINIVIFGVCFGVMAVFTFLPPIILTGLIFTCLLVAFIFRPSAR